MSEEIAVSKAVKPPNKGKKWKDTDDSALLANLDQGKKIAELAEINGRSKLAIKCRIYHILYHKEQDGEDITELLSKWPINESKYLAFKENGGRLSRKEPRKNEEIEPVKDIALSKQRTRPSNRGKKWEDNDDRALLTDLNQGKKAAELADIHGRSEYAINCRINYLLYQKEQGGEDITKLLSKWPVNEDKYLFFKENGGRVPRKGEEMEILFKKLRELKEELIAIRSAVDKLTQQ